MVSEGDEFRAMVLEYNNKFKCWNLNLEYELPIDEDDARLTYIPSLFKIQII